MHHDNRTVFDIVGIDTRYVMLLVWVKSFPTIHGTPKQTAKSHYKLPNIPLGTVQNLLYDMAGGEENFLEKNLLAPYKIIVERLTALSPFP